MNAPAELKSAQERADAAIHIINRVGLIAEALKDCPDANFWSLGQLNLNSFADGVTAVLHIWAYHGYNGMRAVRHAVIGSGEVPLRRPWAKGREGGSDYEFTVDAGEGLKVVIVGDHSVCKRVKTGTRTVEAPDPHAPLVTVEEDVFEWVCP